MTNKSVIPIEAFEKKLFFSSSASERKRLVYHTTADSLFCKFFNNSVSSKSWFKKRNSGFAAAEIRRKNKPAKYFTTVTLQHKSWYVQINDKGLIK